MIPTEKIVDALCDPDRFTLSQASALALKLRQQEPKLERMMIQQLFAWKPASARAQTSALRLLELIMVLRGRLGALFLTQLLQHQDTYVRSRAAALLGKLNQDPRWVSHRLRHPDARVRANALESLWGVAGNSARAVLLEGLKDPHHRVQGNALLGLYRLGDSLSIGRILEMRRRPEELFRATAAWVMAATGDLRFLAPVEELVRDPSPMVHARAGHSLLVLQKRKSYYDSCPVVPVQVSEPQVRGQLRRFRVFVPPAAAATCLPATNFELWEGAELIVEYSVDLPTGESDSPAGYQVEYHGPESSPESSQGRLVIYAENWSGQAQFALPKAKPETTELSSVDLELQALADQIVAQQSSQAKPSISAPAGLPSTPAPEPEDEAVTPHFTLLR